MSNSESPEELISNFKDKMIDRPALVGPTGEIISNLDQSKDEKTELIFNKEKLNKDLQKMIMELRVYPDDPKLPLRERSRRDAKRREIRKKYPQLEPLLRMRERQLAGRLAKSKKTQSRNSPCKCGSGKKYKKCCISMDTR